LLLLLLDNCKIFFYRIVLLLQLFVDQHVMKKAQSDGLPKEQTKRDTEDIEEWCLKLPKVELHAHLNGSIRDSTITELAQQKDNISAEELATYKLGKTRNLKECFDLFTLVYKLTTDEDIITRITKEVIQDFSAENVKYLELRTTPRSFGNMTERSYVEAVICAIEDCQDKYDIVVKLLLSINRGTFTSNKALDTVKLATEYRDRCIVGIDFSGNPNEGKIDSFIPALNAARRSNLKLSVHIAEIENPLETEKILSIHPNRIGHAIFLDEENLKTLNHMKIPLELCLTSNIKTESVNNFVNHHFKEFYERHYPVTLCTDDKGIFSTTLSHEYSIAGKAFNLSKDELFNLSLNSIDFIFGDEQLKTKLRQQFLDKKEELGIGKLC